MKSSSPIEALTLQQMRYLVAVVERGTYKQDDRLRRGQPAVSRGIREMERILGAPLFEEDDRTRPTEFGSKVTAQARRILGDVEALGHLARDEAGVGRVAGMLHLGTKASLAGTIVAGLLADFRRKHGRFRVRVRTGGGKELLDMLERGEVEVAVSHERARPEGVSFRPFETSRRLAVAPRDHEIHRARPFTAETLAQCALILPERTSRTHREVLAALGPHAPGGEIETVLEVLGAETRIRFAAEGWGVAIVEEAGCPALPRGLRARPIPGAVLPARRVGIYRREGRYLSAAGRAFCG